MTPQLEYDLTWKDETAKKMIDIGREVPEKGIDEPQVQLIYTSSDLFTSPYRARFLSKNRPICKKQLQRKHFFDII